MKRRVHAVFSGQVQGVGFRFTTEDIARSFDVAGWVRNLKNGEVEILAEGEERALQDFIERIKEQFGGYIAGCEMTWEIFRDEFRGFDIKF